MLKVIDNYNLENLKDFGFIKYPYDDYYQNGKIRINSKRNIRIVAKGSPYEVDVIYDMVKAGIIEKV